MLINLNPQNPHYQLGSVEKLIKSCNFPENHLLDDRKECVVIIHPTGHGSQQDLETLISDLKTKVFL